MIGLSIVALASSMTNPNNGPSPRTDVFSCSVGNRHITIRAVGANLIYRSQIGTAPDLEIIGTLARRNVHFRAARYFSMEYQLRFINGPYSYIAYSIGSNPTVDAKGTSGVIVMKGARRVADLTCRPWAELHAEVFELLRLPEDGEAYSAM